MTLLYQDNRLHRRYANSGRCPRASFTTPRDPLVDTTRLGVYSQSRQISAQINPRDRFPGPGSQLSFNGDQPARVKAEVNQGRDYKTPLTITSVGQTSVSVHKEVKRSRSSSFPILPPPARQLEKHSYIWKNGYENAITLSQRAQKELSWWKQHFQTLNSRCLIRGRGKF